MINYINLGIYINLHLTILFFQADAQVYSFVTSLYDYVTTGTYPYVRPEANLGQATNVSFKFYLASLNDIDDNAGKFAVSGFFEIAWKDSTISWNPASYDNANNIEVPQTAIWKPYLFHANPYKAVTIVSMLDSRIKIYEDGSAFWIPAVNFESSCDADVSFFPFDSQTCEIWILPWQQNENEVNILLSKTTVDITYYSQNSQWDYVSSKLYVKKSWNSLHISMTFKRHPTYFMLNVIFPIILLGVLNIFVFVLPVDSGERVGFGITILLSIAVFMTIVSDSLPSTSSPRLSSVGIFLCVYLTLSTLIMVCLILGLTIYHRDDQKPITRFWLRVIKATRFCFERKKVRKINVSNYEEQKSSPDEEIESHGITWKEVGHSLDRLFMLIFGVLMAVSMFGFAIDIIAGVN